MLFRLMPGWLLALWLAVSCAVNYVAVMRLWQSPYLSALSHSVRWWRALTLTAALGGILTFAIFFIFLGPWLALLFGVFDGMFHWGSGVYLKRCRKYVFEPGYFQHALAVRVVHIVLYALMIAFALAHRHFN